MGVKPQEAHWEQANRRGRRDATNHLRRSTQMKFPKQRLRFTTTHEGHTAEDGYLILDLKGLDIEGATTLVIDMTDVDTARSQGDKQDEAMRRAKELLGG